MRYKNIGINRLMRCLMIDDVLKTVIGVLEDTASDTYIDWMKDNFENSEDRVRWVLATKIIHELVEKDFLLTNKEQVKADIREDERELANQPFVLPEFNNSHHQERINKTQRNRWKKNGNNIETDIIAWEKKESKSVPKWDREEAEKAYKDIPLSEILDISDGNPTGKMWKSLDNMGLFTVGDILEYTAFELLYISGLGITTLNKIREGLKQYGLFLQVRKSVGINEFFEGFKSF